MDVDLKQVAREVRKSILTQVFTAKSGHPGGSLSATEILTYLYFKEMHVDPTKPNCPCRDRFVLSKGHVTPALYGVLAERGFFPKEELKTFRALNSRLQGHPNMNDTPGAADLFIVARDLEDFIANIPEDEKIVLSNILDKDEMKEKLTEKFGL